MFVFALLVSYLGGEEAIYTASVIIARFENTTILLACMRCVLPVLTHVDVERNFRSIGRIFNAYLFRRIIISISKCLWITDDEFQMVTG